MNKNKKIIAFKLDEITKKAYKKLEKLNLEAIIWNKIGSYEPIKGKLITKNKDIDFEDSKIKISKLIVDELF